MRDYIGSDVAAAQEMIKALAPPPVPVSKPTGAFKCGGKVKRYSSGGRVMGHGDGRSDSIPMPMADGGQAALSDGEYVFPADVVSALGRGSSDAGAKMLDGMVEEVRSDWAGAMGAFDGPKAGGRKKLLGGLFKGPEAKAELELTPAANVASDSIAGLLKGIRKTRPSPGQDVAEFTPDQLAYLDRARQFATGDPTGFGAKTDLSGRQLQETIGGVDALNAGIGGMYGNLDRGQAEVGALINNGDDVRRALQSNYGTLQGQQGEIRGAQDFLGDVISDGGAQDALVAATLGSFDDKASRTTADRNRLRQARGAFGARRDLAESNEQSDLARERALVEAGLRSQGLDRQIGAARDIGGLAGTSGALVGQGANVGQAETGVINAQGNLVGTRGTLTNAGAGLAGTQGQLLATRGNLATGGADIAGAQRNAAAGDLDVLRGIGQQQQEQEQKRLDAPFQRVNRYNQVLSGAPSTSVQTGGGPSAFQQILGTAATGAGIASGFGFFRDGGKVEKGYADGGLLDIPEDYLGYVRSPYDPDFVPPAERGAFVGRKTFPEIMSPSEALAAMPPPARPSMDEFGRKVAEFEAVNGPINPLAPTRIRDALGLGYEGSPDTSRIDSIERRAMRSPLPEKVAPKSPVLDAVQAVVAAGKPRQKPPAKTGQKSPASAAPSAPPSKPADRGIKPPPFERGGAGVPDPISAPGAFIPEVVTRSAAEKEVAAEKKPSFGRRLEGAFTNPLTQFGLALLASRNPDAFGAIGEAGIVAANQATERRRQERLDAREERIEKRDEERLVNEGRKLNLTEKQIAGVVENQRLMREAAAADKAADNARADALLGIRRGEAERDAAYKQARLGQYGAGLELQRRNTESLIKDRASGGGAKRDPVKRARLINLYGMRDKAIAEGLADPETLAAIDDELALLEGPPEGFAPGLSGEEFRRGGMVKTKKPKKGKGAFMAAA